MKKKIINGILMVAMLFAATTSFVSCKDNVDDEILPVYAQLTQTKNELSTRISNLEGQISALQSDLGNVKADVNTIKGQIATLQDDVNDLKGKLATVESQIAAVAADVQTLKDQMAEIDARLTDVEYNVSQIVALLSEGLITEIAVNQTVNDVLGTMNIPGFNAKILAALFGDNQTYIEDFPVAGKDYNVNPNGDFLTAADIAGAKKIELYSDYITKPNGNGGKLFFTANSLDKSLFDINDWTLTFEASDGRVAPVRFENVQPSNYNIQWGFYKSVVLGSNEATEDRGFYEADATIDREYLEQCKLNARNYVNFGELKNDIKAAVETVKAAAGTKAKVVSIAKEAAQLIEKYISGKLSGNNNYLDNPTYSAQRLVLTKTLEDVSVRFQDADLDVALTAIAPLSYNTFWNMEKNAKKPNLDFIEKAVARLAKAIKARIPSIDASSVNIKKIEYPENPISQTGTVWDYEQITKAEYDAALAAGSGYPEYDWNWFNLYDEDGNITGGEQRYFKGTQKEVTLTPFINIEGWTSDEYGHNTEWYGTITKDGVLYTYVGGETKTYNEAIAKPIIDAINEGLDLDQLKDMLAQVTGIPAQLSNSVDNVAARFNSAIERLANGIVNALKNHALTRAVSPIILYTTTEGVNRLVSGTTVKAGYMQINMTSPTEEIIVPPYEKYIAVKDASGKITQSATVPGNTQLWTLDLTKAGDYTVILSCVDYYGYVVTKKYDITVE